LVTVTIAPARFDTASPAVHRPVEKVYFSQFHLRADKTKPNVAARHRREVPFPRRRNGDSHQISNPLHRVSGCKCRKTAIMPSKHPVFSLGKSANSLCHKEFGFLLLTQWYALLFISLYQTRNYVKCFSHGLSCLPITYQGYAKNMMSFLMSYFRIFTKSCRWFPLRQFSQHCPRAISKSPCFSYVQISAS